MSVGRRLITRVCQVRRKRKRRRSRGMMRRKENRVGDGRRIEGDEEKWK